MNLYHLTAAVGALAISGCFYPGSPPSKDFQSAASSAENSCPTLSGIYQIDRNSPLAKFFFEAYLSTSHPMELVELSETPHSAIISAELRMREASFKDAVERLKADKGQWQAWQALIAEWQRAKQKNQSVSVLENKLAKLGPLPQARMTLSRSACHSGWASMAYQYQGNVEHDYWLASNTQGELVLRILSYSTASSLFQTTIRTGITDTQYFKIAKALPADFIWELPTFTQQASSRSNALRADLPNRLVDLQQSLIAGLTDATLSYFMPDPASLDALKSDSLPPDFKFWLNLKLKIQSPTALQPTMDRLKNSVFLQDVELTELRQSEQGSEASIRVALKLN